MQIFSVYKKQNCQPDQISLELPGYEQYWNSAVKKGYSGTAVFTRIKPLSVTNGIGIEEHDQKAVSLLLSMIIFISFAATRR